MAYDLVEQTPYLTDYGFDNGRWMDFYSAVTLGPYSYDGRNTSGYLRLSDRGCKVPGSNPVAYDCQTACLNTTLGPALVWNNTDYDSMYTLSNCVMLPVIAALLASSKLTPGGVGMAKKYGITPNADLIKTPAQAWPVISGCINAYCSSGSDGGLPTPGCQAGSDNPDDYLQYTLLPNQSYYTNQGKYDDNVGDYWWSENFTFSGIDSFNSGICHDLNAFINADIGGVGMFVSYLMQTFIVLSAWILFHVYANWSTYPILLALLPFHGRRRASTVANNIQGRMNFFNDALVAALADFQKAQVFFMLSVQIAILVALHNAAFIQANTWQALWNNFGILYSLAFGGSLPILFVLVLLRIAGKKELYTLLFSLVSVVLSGTTWFIAWFSAPDPNTSIPPSATPAPAECAGTAPIKYCYSAGIYYNATEDVHRAVPMLTFCFVVMLVLVLNQIVIFTIHSPDGVSRKGTCFQWLRGAVLRLPFWRKYDDKAEIRSRYIRLFHLDTSERIVQLLHGLLLFATECTFVSLNMVLIADYAHLLTKGNDFQTLDTKSWSLGQIIAVTIWVPILIEYLWRAAVGIEKSENYRLPPGYRLVRAAETSDAQAADEVHDVSKSKAYDPYGESSSAVDLDRLEPVGLTGRAVFERVGSNNWLLDERKG
ncbi:hypothetical protein LTR62_003468 [Meristemomyces frigidus]|uniref:Uncharacterized protein n=1 Tax=Meristemomyces frigidus TaxID=1508187 RepID=A0AAN7TFH4_9PEZI|nr:hypothetical protein LTR62_003468 [Meristemomyces frigidus]